MRYLITVGKLALTVVLWYYLVDYLREQDLLSKLSATSSSFRERPSLLIVAFGLLLINLGLEVLKWQYLIPPTARLSFSRAFAAVLAGHSIGLWMPARNGEVAGRLLLVEASQRWRAAGSTAAARASQLVATCIAGATGLLFYASAHEHQLPLSPQYALVLAIGLLILLFSAPPLAHRLRNRLHYKLLNRLLAGISKISSLEIIGITLYSLLRYLVYASQFVLLIYFFGGSGSYLYLLMLVSCVFFVQSVVPGNILTDLGVRGSAALYFFGSNCELSASAFSATYMLWLINIMLPALGGWMVILLLQTRSKR